MTCSDQWVVLRRAILGGKTTDWIGATRRLFDSAAEAEGWAARNRATGVEFWVRQLVPAGDSACSAA